MGHKKEMAKRISHKQTNKQKHRYMDYEKMDLPNPDVGYEYLDLMAITKAKKSIEQQKEQRKMIRRIRKM